MDADQGTPSGGRPDHRRDDPASYIIVNREARYHTISGAGPISSGPRLDPDRAGQGWRPRRGLSPLGGAI